MKKELSLEEQTELINSLCVKTYLEILGYYHVNCRAYVVFASPISAGRLYVDFHTNRFRLSHGSLTGGVLDLACAIFRKEKTVILKNLSLYRIDLLLYACGDRRGACWHALSFRPVAVEPIDLDIMREESERKP
ncbi:MAG TPA: hypothetical protein VGM30_19670 [Puia sp.]|jgi:hypothetical protein